MPGNMQDFTKKYYDLLTGEFAGINLTRITDYDEFYNKQILDSIEPLKQSNAFAKSLDKNGILVDVGFGGGFPILPLAELNKDKKFIGIETRNKKVVTVGKIADSLGLKNVSLQHSRIENVIINRPVTITLKAVGKVFDFLSKINSNSKCQVFFYKGPNYYDFEAAQIKEAKKEWNIIEEKEIELQGVEKRYIIGFENKNVPCGTMNIRGNDLVKLSDLL